ncbi:NAD+ synthase [Georgenia sp. Z1344]|uniref:NAD+ synthase n=1 Tax=Georgenia sp. Z1344 TaxID=3416706 RepID=UPI003CFA47FC
MPLSIAIAQVNPCAGDLLENSTMIRDAVAEAARGGARVVLLPEMVLPGYPVEDLALRSSFRAATAETLETLAADLASDGLGDVVVVLGTLGTSAHGRPTNCAAVVTGGAVTDTYVKRHLPTYGVFDEIRIFEPGAEALTIEVDGRRLGIAICEDIWVEGGASAAYAGAGLDALLVLNGSPYEFGKGAVRERLAGDVAGRLGCPLVYANLAGAQDDLVFDGQSFVVDSAGSVVARAGAFGRAVLPLVLADPVDPAGDAAAATGTDAPGDAARHAPGVVVPEQDAVPDAPSDVEQMYTACVVGLRDYARKNRFGSVVLGLSGGIDSALVAAMAADALGGGNVVGVSMPSSYSSAHSKDDAAASAEAIGLDYRVRPIAPMVEAFLANVELTGVAEENLQARVRGVILMGLSNMEGHLVLATGNKSELAVGYSTIYGDAVGGFAPIKDVPKTKVWELARWRNELATARGESVPIPWSSIEKPPSAELRPGQQDSDSLPPYDQLDPVIEDYVERNLGRADLLAAGHAPEVVDRVLGLVDRAEWKRRQYPLGPKVTALAFGRDRRLPVTSRWHEQDERQGDER